MMFAHEVGLADKIERIRSVVAMTRANPDVMRDNPLGKIPTLITADGHVLFDSIVICEYLDSLHSGQKLFPASGAERWEALGWHALGDGMLDTLILWRNEREKASARQTPEWLTVFETKIRNSVNVIEREAGALTNRPFGIGHIGIGCALGYIDFRLPHVAWREGHSRAAAWFDEFSQRESVQLTAPVDA
jgi:glutathione S-transferase